MESLLTVFDRHVHCKFNSALVKKISLFKNEFMTKDSEYAEFFGGPLLGVHRIKWMPEDTDYWIYDIAMIDDVDELERETYRLPEINSAFKNSSNIHNLLMIYLLHKIHVSNEIPQKDKINCCTDVMMCLNIKFLTSVVNNKFFKFPISTDIAIEVHRNIMLSEDVSDIIDYTSQEYLDALAAVKEEHKYDPDYVINEQEVQDKFLELNCANDSEDTWDVSLEVYNHLTKRFGIKNYGSWAKLLYERSLAFIISSSPHYLAYTKMTDDNAVVKMINDAKKRINDTIKEYADVFYTLYYSGNLGLKSTSSNSSDEDFNISVKDVIREQANYERYLKEIITDEASFVKSKLVKIVTSTMATINMPLFTSALIRLTEVYDTNTKYKYLNELIKLVVNYTFKYIRENTIDINNLVEIISKLKINMIAGRSNDPDLVKMRTLTDKFINSEFSSYKGRSITSERVGVLLYIVLRMLSMKFYKK